MDQYSPAYFFMNNSDQLNSRFNTYSKDKDYSDDLSPDKDDEEYNPYSHDLKPVTKTIKKGSKKKRGYVTVSNELRIELIEAVHRGGEKVKSAAKRLGINYSSAKAICQIYKREGRFDKKMPRKSDPEQEQQEQGEEEEEVVYAIQSTPVFVSSGNESPVEPANDQAKEDVAENQTNRTSSTKESFLVVKDPVMNSYQELQKPALISQETEKVSLNPAFPQTQPLVPEYTKEQIFQQNINHRTTQNILPHQQVAFPMPLQDYLALQQSPIMPSFPSNQPIFISNLPIQLANGSSLTMANQAVLVNPVQTMQHPNYLNRSQYINPAQIKPQNISYLAAEQSFPMQPQPQLSYIYPHAQPINIANSQITQMGSAPLMVNPVYYMPTQNINMSLASFPQSVQTETNFRTPYYNQGIYRNPAQNNVWNPQQAGNVPYSIQNYNNNISNDNKFDFPR